MEVLRVEKLSKLYRLGEVGTGTVTHDLNRWWAKLRGKEDPFIKIGKSNDRTSKGESRNDYAWAIKDITFSVQQGEVVGIIGKNGAGKSTLLKIISRITGPTEGHVKMKGRIASLLEVGTGFHPEMTGRENIFMNGTLLGMSRREIRQKLDEIVDFAGVAFYLDTPVKRYSSGMMVRLGFSVAAFLEPEILIVDEVLAVGDAEFQKKALGRMQDVSKKEGRTVLFVSHNMAAVEALTTWGVVLHNGRLEKMGTPQACISEYLSQVNSLAEIDVKDRTDREGIGSVKIVDVQLIAPAGLSTGKTIIAKLYYEANATDIQVTEFGISIWNEVEVKLVSISSLFKNELSNIPLSGVVECEIPSLPLVEGKYFINCFVRSTLGLEDYITRAKAFFFERSNFYGTGKATNPTWGLISVDHSWRLKN